MAETPAPTATPKSFYNEKVNIDVIKALVEKANSAPEVVFKDVPKDSPTAKTIELAARLGIVKGHADGSFKPNQSISRAEIVYMLSKVMNTSSASNPTKFNDIAGSWAEDAIHRLSDNGIINGAGDGSFNPNAKATRSESLLMILRLLNVSLGHSLDID
ncbi:S-layer homology domain-containing protein [Paenibacillus wynnii]|uniref:SLH domain-containing protein n=1 Tax=Paenibacillus wynnii TaxID=268407 RepID=A0A098MBJ4_9BACL|nr:S-layer homology domain-containing protein [Paenibacillus wynnii]KGE19401.1 hypothetical protein PWYN_08660 [Paenibacillus wynnii]